MISEGSFFHIAVRLTHVSSACRSSRCRALCTHSQVSRYLQRNTICLRKLIEPRKALVMSQQSQSPLAASNAWKHGLVFSCATGSSTNQRYRRSGALRELRRSHIRPFPQSHVLTSFHLSMDHSSKPNIMNLTAASRPMQPCSGVMISLLSPSVFLARPHLRMRNEPDLARGRFTHFMFALSLKRFPAFWGVDCSFPARCCV